jgi:Holliday junction resolvase RusA-like endonuclease
VITFDVLGTPVTQGSTKAFVVGKRAIVTHDKRKPLMDWRGDIAHAAANASCGQFAARGVPVTVVATFRLQRPKSAPKRVTSPTTKPDLDKLSRSLLDALTGVLWADDSQVELLHVTKRFAAIEEAPGVWIRVDFV